MAMITIPKDDIDQPDLRVGEAVELSVFGRVTSISGDAITFDADKAQVVDIEPISAK